MEVPAQIIPRTNYATSNAINYEFLINVIVECVLCLVINNSRDGTKLKGGKKIKIQMKINCNFLISLVAFSLHFTIEKKEKIASQFET
jgi:hypothetical protein